MIVNDEISQIIFRDKYISCVNIGLGIAALLSGLYLIVLFGLMPETDIKSSLAKKTIAAIDSSPGVKKSEKYYERILSRRQLFLGQAGNSGAQKKDSGMIVQPDSSLAQLQLLGVVSGAQGPQAIIGNAANDRSYYCYGGENVEGFTVTEVKSDKVILKKDDQVFELRL